jgi:hypothetical protein
VRSRIRWTWSPGFSIRFIEAEAWGLGGYAIEDLGGQEAAIGVALQGGKIVAAGLARRCNVFIGDLGGRDTRVALARFRGR